MKCSFGRIFRLFDCALIIFALGYLIIVMGIDKFESSDFRYWTLSTLSGILFCQLLYLIFTEPASLCVAFFQGFLTVPLCITSCVMGGFHFAHVHDLSLGDYEDISFFSFLGLNFIYLILSSMLYISKSIDPLKRD